MYNINSYFHHDLKSNRKNQNEKSEKKKKILLKMINVIKNGKIS